MPAAKATKSDVLTLAPSDLHWFQEDQRGERDNSFGEPIKVFPPQFTDGWDVVEGCVLAYKLTPEQQEAAVAERREQVRAWTVQPDTFVLCQNPDDPQNPITSTYAALAVHAQEMWTDKDGAWIKPNYGGNCCYRRGFALPACILSYRHKHGEEADFRIPIVMREYANDAQRLADRLKENAQVGRAGYTLVDMLSIALKLVVIGYKESEIKNTLNLERGTSQKIHGWAQICSKYADLNLLERARMSHPVDGEGKRIAKPVYEEGGYYPFSSVKPGACRTLLAQCKKPEAMDSLIVDNVFGGQRDITRLATEEEVEQYVRIMMSGRTNAAKVMDKGTMQVHAGACPSELGTEVLNAIVANDSTKLSELLQQIAVLERRVAELEAQLEAVAS